MHKKLLVTAVFIIAAVLVFACFPENGNNKNIIAATEADSDKGIQFIESDWKKALAEAKKQNKLIFLDAYTTWCGPCRMLKQYTFPDKAVGEFFNENFINIALDMEKGDGPAVARQYQVNAYPTLIFADGDGNMITYTKGYIDAKQLLEFGKFGLSKKPNK
jgi:thioredoxin 1